MGRSSIREDQIFTIGHSNHTPDHFLSLLKMHEVGVLADVRSQPYSRYSPQFNRESLSAFLDANDIRYEFMGGHLGGRPDDPECYDDESRVVYDRMEETESYREGIGDVQWELREGRRVCLMCSEEDPAVCHRALSVGHVLSQLGLAVLHIRGDGRLENQTELHGKAINKPQQGSLFEEAAQRKSLQPVSRERPPSSSSRS